MSPAKEQHLPHEADHLSESLEDYLEAILHIEEEKRAARPKDIAVRLGVSPPSVTGALQNLAARGLVNYRPYDLVTLTPQGRRMASDVRRRHEGLRRFFVDVLRIDDEEADRVACDMEHAVPTDVMDRLLAFVDFVGQSPHHGVTWSHGAGFGLRSLDGAPSTAEQD